MNIPDVDLTDLKNILDAISNQIIILDLNKHILFMNESAKKLVPYPYEECLHQSCSCFHTPYCNTKDCCVERFLRGEEGMIQRGPNGLANRVSLSELKNNQGERIGYISVSTDIRELIDTQRQLVINEERYKIALTQSKSILWRYDPYANTLERINHSDKYHSSILSNTSVIHHVPESLWEHHVLSPECIEEVKAMTENIKNGTKEYECTLKMKDKEGKDHWINILSTTIFDDTGTVVEAIGISKDVTKEKQLELDYRNEKEYHDIISSDFISVYEVNLTRNRVLNANKRWLHELNINEEASYEDLQCAVHELLHPDFRYLKKEKDRQNLIQRFHNGDKQLICEYRKLVNGDYHWIRSTTKLFQHKISGDIIACTSMKDIEDEKRREAEWKKKAERDLLTGVYNHSTAVSLINDQLHMHQNDFHAFIIMDLDNFKDVNDTYGHLYGDLVLTKVAKQLVTTFANSIIGRLGGDEFVVFLPCITDKGTIVDQCERLCEHLNKETFSHYEMARVSVSIGISYYQEPKTTFDELYRKADIAMYYGKNNGKNQCTVYEEQMKEYNQIAKVGFTEDGLGPIVGNIREFIFKNLFTSDPEEFERTLQNTLKLITLYFGGQHSYIIQCDVQLGEAAMIEEWMERKEYAYRPHLSSLPKEELMAAILEYQKTPEGIMFANDTTKNLSTYAKAHMQRTKAKTMALMRIPVDSVNYLVIGFCDLKRIRTFTRQQKNDLKTIYEIIGIFLLNHAQKLKLRDHLHSMISLLDHIGNAVYVIDPTDHRLIYFNEETAKLFPEADHGHQCFRCFRNFNTPCTDCPVSNLKNNKKSVVTIYNKTVGQWVRTTASEIDWPDGHHYILLSCVDVTSYKC